VAKFTGSFHQDYTLQAPLEAARDHFADLDAVIANYGSTLERADKQGDGTLSLWLKDQNYGVTRFRGHYVCRWSTPDEHTVRWETLEAANMDSSGTARFERLPDGRTHLVYDIRLVLDIDVGRLLTKVIGKVVEQAIAREARAYVERLIATLPASPSA
jgi:uncharacterized membrane protein